jgi:cysteine synthase A
MTEAHHPVESHMGDRSVIDRIGNTPLELVDGVLVKLECSNPFGSVKDRIARFMVEEARRRGDLHPGDSIVEATSGNTGIALAAVARELGHPAIIFIPEHMSAERLDLLRLLGADVRLTPRDESFAGACARRDELRGKPGYWVPDQFGNPDNTRCHRETTGREIIEQVRARGIPRVDAFVAGVGTGGTLMGVGQALKDAFPGVAIVAVEPTESAVMSGGCAGEHDIQGIGDGFIPALVDMSFVDEVSRNDTREAHDEARRIHDVHGYCVGMSAGANMLTARRLAEDGRTVVTLWPDCSDRYVSMGLEPPGSEGSRCPMAGRCADRVEWIRAGQR